ncbi:MAG: TonB-dependent receptor [Tannerellaceae bacterium]|nr:TonB-dependent receptor [Tannerellaceae bacterium]MCD8264387.1 TonB-dependent receptor [Tannerellaceae bacterium]
MEFVARYDGSYIFPAGKRYGFFSGFLVGWVASEESFWQDNIPAINYFKIRASWGQTGNDRVDAYQYLSSFSYSGENQIFGETEEVKALYSSRIGNPNITWEVANQSNIAFESQFLDGKWIFGMDFFYNKRKKILIKRNASVPEFTGINLPDENIGKIENKGFDFDLAYRSRVRELTYNLSLNGGYAKIKYCSGTRRRAYYLTSRQQVTPCHQHPRMGKDIWTPTSIIRYKAIGIFRTQEDLDKYPHWPGARLGDIIFEDVNGDGEINADDRIRSHKNVA